MTKSKSFTDLLSLIESTLSTRVPQLRGTQSIEFGIDVSPICSLALEKRTLMPRLNTE